MRKTRALREISVRLKRTPNLDGKSSQAWGFFRTSEAKDSCICSGAENRRAQRGEQEFLRRIFESTCSAHLGHRTCAPVRFLAGRSEGITVQAAKRPNQAKDNSQPPFTEEEAQVIVAGMPITHSSPSARQ